MPVLYRWTNGKRNADSDFCRQQTGPYGPEPIYESETADREGATGDVARTIDQIVGMELRHPVPPGQPLRNGDLVRPPLVRRGAIVQVQLQAGGLSVSGQAVAMEAGADGDRIHVQNLSSRATLTAEVIGAGMVRVVPDVPAVYPTANNRYQSRLAAQ